ncbi:MAG: GNAT family N-acetyltransferase [Acidobacteriota bacterium]
MTFSSSEEGARAAVEANMAEFVKQWNRWSGIEVHDDPEILQTVCDVPFPLFNNISRARLPEGREDQILDRILARSSAPLMWWIGPTTRPLDLADRLRARGLEQGDDLPGMALDLADLPSVPEVPDLEVRRVENDADLAAWSDVGAVGFGFPDFATAPFLDLFCAIGTEPPWHHFVARADGRPVATASLLEGAGVAGLYNVATIPEARNRGIAAEISRRALAVAADLGYRTAILQSTLMAVGVYRRLGFREVCKLTLFTGTPNRGETP